MSYSTIRGVWPGEKTEPLKRLRNAWGCIYPWEVLAERYLRMDFCEVMLKEKWQELCDLWRNPRLPLSHRSILMFTFDRSYVLQKDLLRMAEDIQKFRRDLPEKKGYMNHWDDISKFLRSATLMLTHVPAIGLHMTSVSADPFQGKWNEEKEDYDPFDWSTAYDLYAELEKVPEREKYPF